MIGSIEAGGTKIICAIADESNVTDIIAELVVETRDPKSTMEAVVDFFLAHPVAALGIGAFGPVDIDTQSDTYGYILNTPKLAWKMFDFLGAIRVLEVPCFLTTDVNAAALGEQTAGAAKGTSNCVYVTVGTGVGGGVVLNHEVVPGKRHVEIGHVFVGKLPNDSFEGVCPYHGNCLEGLVSGPAIQKRTGVTGEALDSQHPVWETAAFYLAEACVNYTLSFVPEKIVLGGGVMHQHQLFPLIRSKFKELMGDYTVINQVDTFIVPSALNNRAGIIGGFVLANKILGGQHNDY